MRTTQYVRAEQAIVGADSGGIRQRWLWALRLLADPEFVSTGNGGGLRRGAADKLIAAVEARGMKLNQREIQRRLQCARAYPTESQMRQCLTLFRTWDELINAGFPAIEAEPDEPPADYRTQTEKDHERAQQMLLAVGGQGSLFPDFEPEEVTVKDLIEYSDGQDAITERYARRGRERRAYIKVLSEAVGYDVLQTWQAAHRAAYGSDPE